MKRLTALFVLLFLVASVFIGNTLNASPKSKPTVSNQTKVEVYYFHYTRRCPTCQAVETESQKAVAALFAKEVKAGKVKFIGVNLDDKGSKAQAEKCQAEGQSLLVIGKGKRIDLTDTGFMYARTKPEKLKEELKKAIDPLLK